MGSKEEYLPVSNMDPVVQITLPPLVHRPTPQNIMEMRLLTWNPEELLPRHIYQTKAYVEQNWIPGGRRMGNSRLWQPSHLPLLRASNILAPGNPSGEIKPSDNPDTPSDFKMCEECLGFWVRSGTYYSHLWLESQVYGWQNNLSVGYHREEVCQACGGIHRHRDWKDFGQWYSHDWTEGEAQVSTSVSVPPVQIWNFVGSNITPLVYPSQPGGMGKVRVSLPYIPYLEKQYHLEITKDIPFVPGGRPRLNKWQLEFWQSEMVKHANSKQSNAPTVSFICPVTTSENESSDNEQFHTPALLIENKPRSSREITLYADSEQGEETLTIEGPYYDSVVSTHQYHGHFTEETNYEPPMEEEYPLNPEQILAQINQSYFDDDDEDEETAPPAYCEQDHPISSQVHSHSGTRQSEGVRRTREERGKGYEHDNTAGNSDNTPPGKQPRVASPQVSSQNLQENPDSSRVHSHPNSPEKIYPLMCMNHIKVLPIIRHWITIL